MGSSYPNLDEYCLAKPGAETDYQPDWEADRFMVGGKMFAYIGVLDKENRPILTIKCDPLEAPALREEFTDIIPGYYMNKQHWNTIYLDSDVPQSIINRSIDTAYELVLASFSKKKQAEILG